VIKLVKGSFIYGVFFILLLDYELILSDETDEVDESLTLSLVTSIAEI